MLPPAVSHPGQGQGSPPTCQFCFNTEYILHNVIIRNALTIEQWIYRRIYLSCFFAYWLVLVTYWAPKSTEDLPSGALCVFIRPPAPSDFSQTSILTSVGKWCLIRAVVTAPVKPAPTMSKRKGWTHILPEMVWFSTFCTLISSIASAYIAQAPDVNPLPPPPPGFNLSLFSSRHVEYLWLQHLISYQLRQLLSL